MSEIISEEENPEIVSKAQELLKKVDSLVAKKETKAEKAVSTIKDKLSEGKLKSAAAPVKELIEKGAKEPVLA